MYSMTTTVEIGCYSLSADVEYTFHSGYAGSRVDPPEEPSVEILSIELSTLDGRDKIPGYKAGVKIAAEGDLFAILAESLREDVLDQHEDGPDPDHAYERSREDV
jgi:hypothetical protein